MLAKKNNHAETKPHYSLRKLSVGVASVLISTSVYAGMAGHVQAATADKNPNQITEVKSTENKEDSSVKKDTADKDSSVQLQDVKATGTELSKAAGEQKEAAKTAENGKAEAEKTAAVEKPAEKPATEAKKSELEKKGEDTKAAAKALGASLRVKAADANQDSSDQDDQNVPLDKVDPLKDNRNDLFKNGQSATNTGITKVEASEKEGGTDKNGNVQPGTTNLSFGFHLTESDRQKLNAGDYIDIKMGLPYKLSADGQTYLLSYGKVVDKNTAIPVYGSVSKDPIGYIVPVDADNSYISTAVDKKNPDVKQKSTSSDLGGTNGYYILLFTKNVAAGQGDMQVNVKQLTWYNNVPNNDETKPPLQSKTFQLYSDKPDDTTTTADDEYKPTNDVHIGDYETTSGLKLNVSHKKGVVLNDTLQAISPTRTAAHWWYPEVDEHGNATGRWRIGLNSQTDPSQMEGIALAGDSKTLGNDFTMTVTMPAGAVNNNGKWTLPYKDNSGKHIDYYFTDGDRVQDDIERMIVGDTETVPLDQVAGDIYVHKANVAISTPEVKVTRSISSDGRTATYKVHIDGAYTGFAREFQSNGNSLQSAVTLISWAPSDPRDLLPPADSHIDHPGPDKDPEDPASDPNADRNDYITTHYRTGGDSHVEGVAISKDLYDVLQANPWKASLTKGDSKVNLLNPAAKDPNASEIDKEKAIDSGYKFVKYSLPNVMVPENYGYAAGDYDNPTYSYETVGQVIHYWYGELQPDGTIKRIDIDKVVFPDVDPNSGRTVTFSKQKKNATDTDEPWINVTNPDINDDPTLQRGYFYGLKQQPKEGYDIYIIDENGKAKKLTNPDEEIGWQPFKHDDFYGNKATLRNGYFDLKDAKGNKIPVQVKYVYYVQKPQKPQKQEQQIKYTVKYQDQDGNWQGTLTLNDGGDGTVAVLGTGKPGDFLMHYPEINQKWDGLRKQYEKWHFNGTDYVLVKHGDHGTNGKLHDTDDLPKKFNAAGSDPQVVTIWLVEKKTTTPDNPPKTETQYIRYKVGYQDANGNVQFMSPAENQTGILLGQGPSHSALKSIFENYWEYLQNNVDKTYNGKDYVLVKHGDKGANGQLHDTDVLPELFDDDPNVDQLVMIWLVEKPTTPYNPPETPDNPNPDQPDTPNPDQPDNPTPDQPHNPERPDIPASPTISKRTHTSQTPVVHKTNVPKQKATLPQTGSSYLALAMGALLSLLGLAGLRKKKN